ncbi:MAG: hypothetical protein J7L86_07535 [Candidatus Marinimicrobia bacterium]|nr:hypothetical protein [Candidatus Neomarinimicrobiota bacterium]
MLMPQMAISPWPGLRRPSVQLMTALPLVTHVGIRQLYLYGMMFRFQGILIWHRTIPIRSTRRRPFNSL